MFFFHKTCVTRSKLILFIAHSIILHPDLNIESKKKCLIPIKISKRALMGKSQTNQIIKITQLIGWFLWWHTSMPYMKPTRSLPWRSWDYKEVMSSLQGYRIMLPIVDFSQPTDRQTYQEKLLFLIITPKNDYCFLLSDWKLFLNNSL